MGDPVIDAYRVRQMQLEKAVQGALDAFFTQLSDTPATARNQLVAFVPALVNRYGPVAAEIAVEYYQGAVGAGSFVATPAESLLAPEHMEKSLRRVAGGLWSGEHDAVLDAARGFTGRWVRDYGRETIIHNARREKVGFARVPTGGKTCSFCLIMASRGVVYKSEKSAGSARKFHDHCDCEIVRVGDDEQYPSDYLPDDALAMYEQARASSGSHRIEDITAEMRRLYPDALSDGVFAK